LEESRTFNSDQDMQDEILQLGDNLFCHRGYFLTVQHFTNDVFKYKYSLHRLNNAHSIKESTVVDIGGCSGDSAIVFNRELRPRHLFVFEPNPFWAKQIRQVFTLNDIHNGTVIQGAVGSHEDTLPMTMNETSGMSGLTDISHFTGVPGASHTELVRVAPFDKYVSEHAIKNIGLIKVDIEGFEQEFLKGAKATIAAQRPVLIICIYHSWNDFVTIKPLIESWKLGYTFKIDKAMNGSIVLETVLIAEPPIT
jgi:FkbM family methyltransferase